MHELERLRSQSKNCTRCKLREGCHQVVPSIGPADAKMMIVGEAPGRDEDAIGEPFVGASGQLLDKMLEASGFSRNEVVITNCVRCRPPNNRAPESDELRACKPWLWGEIKLIQPHIIATLGATPSRLLLRGGASFRISKIVGQPQKMDYLPEGWIVPMFHPSYLLRGSRKDVHAAIKLFVNCKRMIHESRNQAEVVD